MGRKDLSQASSPLVLTVLRQIWYVAISDQNVAGVRSRESGWLKPRGQNRSSEMTFLETDKSRDFHALTVPVGTLVDHQPNK